LLDPAFDVRASAAIDDAELVSVPRVLLESMRPDVFPGQVLEVADDWNRQSLIVEAAQPALLVIGETWFPGWQALVDGAPQTLLRVDVNFRGLMLAAGQHRIELRYRPWQFPVGCAVAFVGIAIVGVALVPRLGGRWAGRLSALPAESRRGAASSGGASREANQPEATTQSRPGQGKQTRRRR
jgi:hypothetical protein